MRRQAWTQMAWLATLATGWLFGCSDCSDAVEEMRAFIEAEDNQVCETDADCVVASVGCAELDLGLCGQVGMNKAAASSATWRRLVQEANCEDSCEMCLAALAPGCDEGLCFRAQD